jgi:hypothetical protein
VIVKYGLKRLKQFLDEFRTAISIFSSCNQRIATYKQFCIASGVRPQKFDLDIDVRWKSTYLMLYHLVPYGVTFYVFIFANYQVLGLADALPLLASDHWYVAGKILEFFKLFYDSIDAIYGVYYPTPLMLHHVLLIANIYASMKMLICLVTYSGSNEVYVFEILEEHTNALFICFSFGS